jgi:hypothetical protein
LLLQLTTQLCLLTGRFRPVNPLLEAYELSHGLCCPESEHLRFFKWVKDLEQ